jgi:acetylornithine deacetylase
VSARDVGDDRAVPAPDPSSTVALLEPLVAFATDSRTDNQVLIDWYADRLAGCGAAVTTIAGPPGRSNLLARIGPARAGGLLLSGHTDVVPAGEGWHHEPYEVTADGGRLYGRGTADMKGFLACALAAAGGLDATRLSRPVHFALSYDEEVGCIGVRDLLAHARADETIRPDLVLIGEPTMLVPCLAHSGKLAYRVVVTAPAGHSSKSRIQRSALASAVAVAAAVEAAQRQDAVGARPGPRALSTNVGTIAGGVGLNVLAPRCELTFELRSSADLDAEALLAPVWDAVEAERRVLGPLGGAIAVEELQRYPGLLTAASDPHVHELVDLAGAGQAGTIDYGTEGGLFRESIDTTVVIVGPGDIGDAHRPDEYVDLDQLARAQGFVERAIARWCTTS